MIRQFDESTLSAFLDGELDDAAMQEVDEFLQRDAEAREYVVNAARATAFLKAASNTILHAKVPEHLVAAVESQKIKKWRRKPAARSLMRIAAAVILVFAGFGAGRLIINNEAGLPISAASVLQQYSDVVDVALENNLSGSSHKWSKPRQPMMIMVTPIRTYRDSQNVYFREYRLEVIAGNRHQQFNGLAYRTGGGKWITKALFF